MSKSILVSLIAFSFLTACASSPEKTEAQDPAVSDISSVPTESAVAANSLTDTVMDASASASDSTYDKAVKKKKSPKKKKKPSKRKQRV